MQKSLFCSVIGLLTCGLVQFSLAGPTNAEPQFNRNVVGRVGFAVAHLAVSQSTAPPTDPDRVGPSAATIVLADDGRKPGAPEEGMKIFRCAYGDLNGDGLDDLAIVYRGTDPNLRHRGQSPAAEPETTVDPVTGQDVVQLVVDTNPRLLRVFLREGDTYRSIASSDSLIPRASGSTGDSLSGFVIVNNRLHIELTSMNRRHGELYAQARYQFLFKNDKMVLLNHSRSDIDRRGNRRVDRDYDFVKAEVREVQYQWPNLKVCASTTKSLTVGDLPLMESLTPDWVYRESASKE